LKTTSKSKEVYRSKPKNSSNGVWLEITKYSFKTALKSLRLEKWINLLDYSVSQYRSDNFVPL
jgi:hypothetical protein